MSLNLNINTANRLGLFLLSEPEALEKKTHSIEGLVAIALTQTHNLAFNVGLTLGNNSAQLLIKYCLGKAEKEDLAEIFSSLKQASTDKGYLQDFQSLAFRMENIRYIVFYPQHINYVEHFQELFETVFALDLDIPLFSRHENIILQYILGETNHESFLEKMKDLKLRSLQNDRYSEYLTLLAIIEKTKYSLCYPAHTEHSAKLSSLFEGSIQFHEKRLPTPEELAKISLADGISLTLADGTKMQARMVHYRDIALLDDIKTKRAVGYDHYSAGDFKAAEKRVIRNPIETISIVIELETKHGLQPVGTISVEISSEILGEELYTEATRLMTSRDRLAKMLSEYENYEGGIVEFAKEYGEAAFDPNGSTKQEEPFVFGEIESLVFGSLDENHNWKPGASKNFGLEYALAVTLASEYIRRMGGSYIIAILLEKFRKGIGRMTGGLELPLCEEAVLNPLAQNAIRKKGNGTSLNIHYFLSFWPYFLREATYEDASIPESILPRKRFKSLSADEVRGFTHYLDENEAALKKFLLWMSKQMLEGSVFGPQMVGDSIANYIPQLITKVNAQLLSINDES